MTRDPEAISRILGEGCWWVVRISSHRVQECRDEERQGTTCSCHGADPREMLLRAHGPHFRAGFSMSDRRWYELPPGVRFRHQLDLAIARLEKAAQVPGQDEPLGHPTERPERRCEVEEVTHDGAASTIFREVVLVIEARERPPNHRVPAYHVGIDTDVDSVVLGRRAQDPRIFR